MSEERVGNYATRPGSALDWKTPSLVGVTAVASVGIKRLVTGYPVKVLFLALTGVVVIAVGLWANYYASTRENSFLFTKDMVPESERKYRYYQKRHGNGPYCVNAFSVGTAHTKIHVGYDVMLMFLVYCVLMFFTGSSLTETVASCLLGTAVAHGYNRYTHGDIDVDFEAVPDSSLHHAPGVRSNVY